jgi:hypothetical protein
MTTAVALTRVIDIPLRAIGWSLWINVGDLVTKDRALNIAGEGPEQGRLCEA